MDILNSVLILIFAVYWKFSINRYVQEAKKRVARPSDYTVMVRNLPAGITETAIYKQFRPFRKIVEIAIARNYGQTFSMFSKLSQLEVENMAE